MSNNHGYNAPELNWLNLYEEIKRVARNHFMQSEDFEVQSIDESFDIVNDRERDPPLVNLLGHSTFTIHFIISRNLDEEGIYQEFLIEYDHRDGVHARFGREKQVQFPLHLPCFAHNVAEHLGHFLDMISWNEIREWTAYMNNVETGEVRKRNLALFMAGHRRLGDSASGPLRDILQDPSGGLYRFFIDRDAHHTRT